MNTPGELVEPLRVVLLRFDRNKNRHTHTQQLGVAKRYSAFYHPGLLKLLNAPPRRRGCQVHLERDFLE